eukprot:m.211846 g.211846  ORF g.211846 m.211846 type:complete len:746 (+) comp25506_c0_seq16:1458-3695(+)
MDHPQMLNRDRMLTLPIPRVHPHARAIALWQVEYRIFVPSAPQAPSPHDCPSPTAQDGTSSAAVSTPSSALQQCNDVAAAICAGHIWQREPFALSLSVAASTPKASADPSPTMGVPTPTDTVLAGCTHFGDNIDDEWLVVHILLQITAAINGAVATVQDSDGEFLLVEAADALPEWVNPVTAVNRVFLAGGALHLIPPPSSPADIGVLPVGKPRIGEAVALVRGPHRTVPTGAITDAVLSRVAHYPEHLTTCVHWTACDLPAELGAALAADPALVAAAVAAFYERDPIDMKQCGSMQRFRVDTRQRVSVKFTRCLYAMLAQQRFESSRVFGAGPRPGTTAHRAHDLGAKLALGFEILASRAGGAPTSGGPADDGAACTGARWERFLGKLRTSGYFRGNIDGSREFTELFTAAKRYYFSSVLPGELAAGGGAARRDHPTTYLDRGAARLHATLAGCGAGPWKLDASRDDDDGWLTLDEAALNKLVRERWGSNPHPDFAAGGEAEAGAEETTAAQLDAMIGKVKGFVNAVSSFEGAEFSEEGAADESGDDTDSDGDDVDRHGAAIGDDGAFDTLGGDGDLTFNFEAFESSLRAMLGGPLPDAQPSDTSADAEASDGAAGEAEAAATPPNRAEGDEDSAQSIADIEAQMDAELAGTKVMESFALDADDDDDETGRGDDGTTARDADSEDTDEQPLDIDLNLVRNALKSFSAQHGMAGPVSNLLGSLDVYLPEDTSSTATADDGAAHTP